MRKNYFVFFVFITVGASSQNFFDEKALIQNLKLLSSDSMQGRRTGTDGSAKAAKLIKAQFKKMGVLPIGDSYDSPFQFQSRNGQRSGINLVGTITGKSVEEKYIVVSAHYDHEGVKDGKIYNGADDNASGVCALLAIAEYFKKNPPKHNVIMVAFDAEELGLQGAKAFVKKSPIELNNIVANINMDMVARADANEIVACGTFFYPNLKPLIEKVGPVGDVRLKFGHDDPTLFKGKENWTYSSDHGPFHSAKIPFIYFGVADHAEYHQPEDDFERVNPKIFISSTKLIILSLIEIDKGLN